MTTTPGPDGFADAVLMRCPDLTAQDEARLRAAVREALTGHPADEWTTRFADMIIDHRAEPFAKPFFERSVASGVAKAFAHADRGPAGLFAAMGEHLSPKAALYVTHSVFDGMAHAAAPDDARIRRTGP